MGTSHSHHQQIPIRQWSQSYPRPRHGQPHVKVLPERVPPLQLRTTDNGAILHNGGTISCRKQSVSQEERIYRRRSTSAHRPPQPKDVPLEKGRFGSEPDLRFHLKEPRDQFGENAVRQRISRSRKKYKAPPAPQNGMSSGVESSSPDLNGWDPNGRDCPGGPCRKGRLFKTRAETHKKNLTSLRTLDKAESELSRSTEALNASRAKFQEEKCKQVGERGEKKGLKRSASQEVISTRKSLATPEFQAELSEAAQRLRPSGLRRRDHLPTGKPVGGKGHHAKEEVLTSLKIEIPEENTVKPNRKTTVKVYSSEETGTKGEKSEERPPRGEGQREKGERDVPFRKFYFGMKEESGDAKIVNRSASTNNVDKTNAEHRLTAVEKSKNLMNLYKSAGEGGAEWEEDTVEKFAANFHRGQMSLGNGNTTSCSSSFVSDPDEDVDGGIALQLRPTLPKKQLEIPRFSPTAAWRLLSSIDTVCSQAPSPGGSDDGPLLLEDRIRPPAQQQPLRSSNDKSGDSGISGDASPGGCHESSSEVAAAPAKAITTQNPKNIIMTWTPQQDLEEESSSDDLESPLNSSKNAVCQIPGARFSPRGQLFLSRDQSLTVPMGRDDRINSINENGDFKDRNNLEPIPKLNSLRKLKVALGTTKRNDVAEERGHSQNDNWLLSRSVPSSLNSHAAVTRSMSNPSSPEQDDDCGQQTSSNYPSYSYLANGGRLMYLPEYQSRMSPDVSTKPRARMGNGFLSKSCENISQPEMKQLQRSRSPSPVYTRNKTDSRPQSEESKSTQKRKKFTFQSTVRLLENRRIAERLSREAELKENQRLCEVEAMKKVEEEFQKKRAREKANIRHQLRLFSLEEKNYSSLPPIDWDDSRGDPDCAPSSLPQLVQNHPRHLPKTGPDVNKFAPSTQVLSEFREPTRDYKDYRHSRYHEPQEFLPDNNRKFVVEHPKVVYDMPKNTAVYVSAPLNSSGQNQSKEGTRAGLSTPRSSSSDNYRKDFAHGALPGGGGRSLTSSDSELSQSHPRPPSRQDLPLRGFAALRRSRSASPESVAASASPPRGSDSSCNSLRSRSSSPVKSFACQKSRSASPKMPPGAPGPSGPPPPQQGSDLPRESLERKPSRCTDHRSKASRGVSPDGNIARNGSFGKGGTDSLLRLGLPSLQPFNRAEKSFRPIKFSPVINKLAQTVT